MRFDHEDGNNGTKRTESNRKRDADAVNYFGIHAHCLGNAYRRLLLPC